MITCVASSPAPSARGFRRGGDSLVTMGCGAGVEHLHRRECRRHGEKDYRVVVTQCLALYGILQHKGIPTRLAYYPDEGHWIETPANSIHLYGEVLDWLARWVWKTSDRRSQVSTIRSAVTPANFGCRGPSCRQSGQRRRSLRESRAVPESPRSRHDGHETGSWPETAFPR